MNKYRLIWENPNQGNVRIQRGCMPDQILITGTAKGLGLYLAEEYLSRGATVYALNRKTSPGEKDLAARFHDRFVVVRCDVSNEKQVKKAAEKVSAMTNGIDILINNAAVYMEKPFTDTNEFDAETAMATYEINALGPLRIAKYFHKLVVAGNGKTYVNISSEAGSISQCWREREYGYCMSKAALNMQSAILQNKLKPAGVKVLAIHPGWLRTDMGGKDADLDPKVTARELIDTIAKNSSPGGQTYIDYSGKPMQW
jgi:NAD(P)-dependent dehydrogenase (short-subunit alcohol dehydrogenase family)